MKNMSRTENTESNLWTLDLGIGETRTFAKLGHVIAFANANADVFAELFPGGFTVTRGETDWAKLAPRLGRYCVASMSR